MQYTYHIEQSNTWAIEATVCVHSSISVLHKSPTTMQYQQQYQQAFIKTSKGKVFST